MARAPAYSTYARIIGEVAVAWNELESRLHSLIYHYLTVDAPVAGFILGEMQNATKAEFARFLIQQYEANEILKEHGLHTVALVNRLRENRNILEHATPFSYNDQYHGTVYKLNKRGEQVPYGAPIPMLKALLRTMQNAAPYVRWLTFCLYMMDNEEFDGFKGGPTTAQAAVQTLASLERPLIPDKIAPLRPLRDPTGG